MELKIQVAPDTNDPRVDASLRRLTEKFRFDKSVVLVNIPQIPLDQLDQEVALNRGYFAYPPQGLLYLAAFFRSLGIPCEILDLNFVVLRATQEGNRDLEGVWKKALDEVICRNDQPLICVSFMFEATRTAFENICRHIRQTDPQLCLSSGGVNATAYATEIIQEGLADIIFRNEGEQGLDGFFRFLRGKTRTLPPNLIFRDDDGEIFETPVKLGGSVDLDIIPEFELLPIREYHTVGCLSNFSRINGLEVPFGTVIAKRGCRARCSFCGVRNFNGKGIRLRDTSAVVDEMVHLNSKYGIAHFDWLDDDLLFDQKASLKLFQEIRERLPNITWAANNGLIPTAVTADLFDAISASGCIGFKVGLETGNPEMLHRVHKPTNVPNFLRFAKRAEKHREVFVSVNFILGLPEERVEQMLDSMNVAVLSKLHWHNFYIYQHLKNTEFYIAYGGLGEDFKVKEHGKDSQSPTFQSPAKRIPGKGDVSFINPVRDGKFSAVTRDGSIRSGYDIFDLPPSEVPARAQINEIWFSINTVVNFILNPCVRGNSEIMLRQMIRWLDVLGTAYPKDAMMKSLQYYLMHRAGEYSRPQLDAARAKALTLGQSEYWMYRDKQFGFSSFLDLEAPKLPEKLRYLYSEQERQLVET
jgi:hypothetical protein